MIANEMTPDEFTIGAQISLPWYGHRQFTISHILRGGMGIVYKLEPSAPSSPPLALKTFQQSLDLDLFQAECEAWLKLSGHPSIASALWYGRLADRPAVLSTWYPFELSQQRCVDWPTESLRKLVSGLVDALTFMETQYGTIHQDIKPSNILLDARLAPKLADFGIVRTLRTGEHSLASLDRSSKGSFCDRGVAGTPFYMAPKLFSNGEPSILTDIFSLGITLHEAITGRHPYLDTNGRFTAHTQVNSLDTVLERHGTTGRVLSRAIHEMIQVDSRNRPQSYSALSSILG